jgi:hypothetical protein
MPKLFTPTAPRWGWLPVTAAAVALTACNPSSALDITDPDVLNISDFNSPAGAGPVRLGVLQDFAVVFSGTIDGVVVSSGNMADEIYSTDTFDDRLFPNQRTTNEQLAAVETTYRNLHRVRSGATRVVPILQEFAPSAPANIAEIYAIRGYSEMFFAELYCSGVPFSSEDTPGTPLTTTEMLETAVASFDSALALAGTDAKVRPLAQIGRARALLNLNRASDAATAVSGVATTYKYETFHSQASGRQENGIWNAISVSAPRYSLYAQEKNVLFLRTPADPRVPWATTTRSGFNSIHRNIPDQRKYTRAGSVKLADGVEARLIELEARLRGGTQGDRQAVYDGLNALRGQWEALGFTTEIPALSGPVPTTQDAAVDLLFEERALWMWLTGHRLGDLRRLIRQYGRTADNTFPSGPLPAPFAGTYGSDVNFVIPAAERNNPNFAGCIDRDA